MYLIKEAAATQEEEARVGSSSTIMGTIFHGFTHALGSMAAMAGRVVKAPVVDDDVVVLSDDPDVVVLLDD